jgi:cyclic pyranopterin phosphate synthase
MHSHALRNIDFAQDFGHKTKWQQCAFLTCSILPVRMACNLRCPFCFSRSSISTLKSEQRNWHEFDLDAYFDFALSKGANRLVVTGGGEPLLNTDAVLHIINSGARYFREITCFTNGTFLTPAVARRLADAGLSYLCYSRHARRDADNKTLMGKGAPALDQFFEAAAGLRIRATCVMLRGNVSSVADVWDYISALSKYGVTEFTFKHTYTAAPTSLFRATSQNAWARGHAAAEVDPFAGMGTELGRLPWGPVIRTIDRYQVCYYYEPTPQWEIENRLCRSVNLLSDGRIYASLEDAQSLLFQLTPC